MTDFQARLAAPQLSPLMFWLNCSACVGKCSTIGFAIQVNIGMIELPQICKPFRPMLNDLSRLPTNDGLRPRLNSGATMLAICTSRCLAINPT